MYVTSLVCAMCATSIVSLLCLTAAPATADPALEGWSAATRGMVPQCDVVIANAHDRAAGKFWLTRELSLWSHAAVGDCTIVMLSTRAKDQVECVGVVAVKSVRWPPHPLSRSPALTTGFDTTCIPLRKAGRRAASCDSWMRWCPQQRAASQPCGGAQLARTRKVSCGSTHARFDWRSWRRP